MHTYPNKQPGFIIYRGSQSLTRIILHNYYNMKTMYREEAIALGMDVHDTTHSMKRRSPRHDYHKKSNYMVTLVVEGHVPLLGEIKGNADAPLDYPDAPHVEYSELGEAIL